MTYCLAAIVDDGLVFVSDSRTNAGIDQLGIFSKMHPFTMLEDRFFTLLSAGNLATTQEVVARIHRDIREEAETSLASVARIRDAAAYIGRISRGTLHANSPVSIVGADGTARRARVLEVFGFHGLERRRVEGSNRRLLFLDQPANPLLQLARDPEINRLVLTEWIGNGPILPSGAGGNRHGPRGVLTEKRDHHVEVLGIDFIEALGVEVIDGIPETRQRGQCRFGDKTGGGEARRHGIHRLSSQRSGHGLGHR